MDKESMANSGRIGDSGTTCKCQSFLFVRGIFVLRSTVS